ncbi:hypothetical protein C8R45DRAFT_1149159 [Mycena sanguinolenta]|nr:hypothetical protein C8R45DRAFT_1149159 [Mycena sanguinolenta]
MAITNHSIALHALHGAGQQAEISAFGMRLERMVGGCNTCARQAAGTAAMCRHNIGRSVFAGAMDAIARRSRKRTQPSAPPGLPAMHAAADSGLPALPPARSGIVLFRQTRGKRTQRSTSRGTSHDTSPAAIDSVVPVACPRRVDSVVPAHARDVRVRAASVAGSKGPGEHHNALGDKRSRVVYARARVPRRRRGTGYALPHGLRMARPAPELTELCAGDSALGLEK